MINYAFHFLDTQPPYRGSGPRWVAGRRAALRLRRITPRLLDLAARSALLRGLRWRAALISGRHLPFFLPFPPANRRSERLRLPAALRGAWRALRPSGGPLRFGRARRPRGLSLRYSGGA